MHFMHELFNFLSINQFWLETKKIYKKGNANQIERFLTSVSDQSKHKRENLQITANFETLPRHFCFTFAFENLRKVLKLGEMLRD